MSKEIAEILLDRGAVTLSPHKPYLFASGIRSPIYCDNRKLISHPAERRRIITAFLATIKELEFDVVGGTATAGIPWAAWIAEELDVPMIYIRSSAKGHGKQNKIEGDLKKDAKVLVIEDLVTTGGSSMDATEAVRAAGGVVTDCVAIFTYGLGSARERFGDGDCRLLTLTDFPTLLDVATEKSYLDEKDKSHVLHWQKDPVGWGAL